MAVSESNSSHVLCPPGLATARSCLTHGKETHWSGQVALEGKEGWGDLSGFPSSFLSSLPVSDSRTLFPDVSGYVRKPLFSKVGTYIQTHACY